LQCRLQVGRLITHHGAAEHRLLPLILQTHLRNGQVELPSKPGHERLEAAALLLKRSTGGQMQVNGEDADHA
jgi:hypothetical protein